MQEVALLCNGMLVFGTAQNVRSIRMKIPNLPFQYLSLSCLWHLCLEFVVQYIMVDELIVFIFL